MSIADLIGPALTLFLAGIGFVVWLVRLEGRVNSTKQSIGELTKDLDQQRGEIVAVKAKGEADTKAHEETKIALVRVEEQLKHLTDLVERLLVASPRRRTSDQ